MKTVLQINRKGFIIVAQNQSSEHQCVRTGHQSYRYECSIKLTSPVLDSRGFITDHEEINALVQSLFKTADISSWEIMAKDIAEAVSLRLTAQGMHHDQVYVKLSDGTVDNPASFMEAWAFPELVSATEETPVVVGTKATPDQTVRMLTLKEIKALPGIRIDYEGDYTMKHEFGYYRPWLEEQYKALVFTEIELTTLRAGGPVLRQFTRKEHHPGLVGKDVHPWMTTLNPDFKPAVPEPMKWVTRSLAEIKADPLVNVSVGGWYSTQYCGKYLSSNNRALWLEGVEPDDIKDNTPEELAKLGNYEKPSYIIVTLQGHQRAIPSWAFKQVPVSATTPTPEPEPAKPEHRILTWDEMLALPGVWLDGDGDLQFRDTNTYFDASMKDAEITLTPEQWDELSDQDDEVRIDILGVGSGWVIATWMTTKNPYFKPVKAQEPEPTIEERVRILEFAELLTLPKVVQTGSGSLKHRDYSGTIAHSSRKQHKFSDLVLSEADLVKLRANQSVVAHTDKDGKRESWTIEPWQTTLNPDYKAPQPVDDIPW